MYSSYIYYYLTLFLSTVQQYSLVYTSSTIIYILSLSSFIYYFLFNLVIFFLQRSCGETAMQSICQNISQKQWQLHQSLSCTKSFYFFKTPTATLSFLYKKKLKFWLSHILSFKLSFLALNTVILPYLWEKKSYILFVPSSPDLNTHSS